MPGNTPREAGWAPDMSKSSTLPASPATASIFPSGENAVAWMQLLNLLTVPWVGRSVGPFGA